MRKPEINFMTFSNLFADIFLACPSQIQYNFQVYDSQATSAQLIQISVQYFSLKGICVEINMSVSRLVSIFSTSKFTLKTHHYHHVMPLARISLILSRHFSLSFFASGRSSGIHPVSSQSCWMYVRAGRPTFARPYVGIHRSTSLMSSSLLLQQCPACLARLTWIVFVMRGRRPYSWCFVGCCRQDLFKIARSILV